MKKVLCHNRMLWAMAYSLCTFFGGLQATEKLQLNQSDKATIQSDVAARFAGLPKNGFAVITGIRNSSAWSAGLEFEKTVHDELPLETIMAFKHRSTGKYLAARKVNVAGKDQWYLKPDADKSDDKAAQFVVDRRISSVPKLKDWIGFQSTPANECILSTNPDGILQFASTDFLDDAADRESHWEILGNILTGCYIRNRDDKGVATFQKGSKEVWVKDDVQVSVEKAMMATVADDRSNGNVCYGDVITLNGGGSNAWVGAYHKYGHGPDTKGLDPYKGDYRGIALLDKNNMLATNSLDCARFMITGPNGEINGNPIGGGSTILLRNLGCGGGSAPAGATHKTRFNAPGGLVQIPGNEWGLAIRVAPGNIAWKFHQLTIANADGSGGILTYGKAITIRSFRGLWTTRPWKVNQTESTGVQVGLNLGCRGPRGGETHDFIICNENFDTIVRGNTAMVSGLSLDGLARANGTSTDLAVRNLSDTWSINESGSIDYWDGKAWSRIASNVAFTNIGVSAAGNVFAVGTDSKLYERTDISEKVPTGRSWQPKDLGDSSVAPQTNFPVTIAYNTGQLNAFRPGGIAVGGKNIIWFIGKNGALFKFDNGQNNIRQSVLTPDNSGAFVTSVSCSDDGATWAVTNYNKIWHLVGTNWQMVDIPQSKPLITSIAVRSDTEVYITAFDNGGVHIWNGTNWTASPRTGLKRLSLGSGVNHKITKITQHLDIAQMMTKALADGAVLDTSPEAMLDIEVIDLGMKGNIKAASTLDLELPAAQNPTVTGFAQTKVSLDSGGELSIQPLKSKGAAWPERTFDLPNRATIAFMAMPGDKGDIQVIFGKAISDSFLFKVIIGGQKNTRSSIIQRTIVDSDYVDTEVFGIDVAQNNLAYASPGNYTPYWITYDNGLILVGMGQPGSNVFMAYRTDAPPKLVNRAGFGSKDEAVKYAEIQYLHPIVPATFKRAYITKPDVVNVSANASAITWSALPFRYPGEGTVAFDMQATEKCVLALGCKDNITDAHYIIVFNEAADEAISLQQWNVEKREYKELASLPNKGYKGLNLKTNAWVSAWVSYCDGLFIIGNGPVGKNPVFVYQDNGFPDGIARIGFGAFGSTPAQIRNLSVLPATSLVSEIPVADLGGAMAVRLAAYAGPVQIILPFDYKIYQVGPSLKVDDRITNQSFFIAGMPQQGALYFYLANIQEDGFLKLAPSRDPENPIQVNINREIVATSAAADLNRAKADIMARQADSIKALGVAAGDKDRAASAGMMLGANAAITAGGAMASAGGFSQNPVALGMSLAVGGAIAIAGIAVASAAGKRTADAAAKDFEGAQQAAVVQRQMLNTQMQAEEQNFRAKLLSGNAQFAFKSSKAYVYVDAPERPPLGNTKTPQEAVDNLAQVTDILNTTSTVPLDAPEGFEKLLSMMQDSVYLMTHYYVVTSFVKKKFADKMNNLFDAYSTLYNPDEVNVRVMNNFINLIFTAINNGYLVNAGADANTREIWYTWANKLAHSMLLQTQSIKLNPCYGEYIWLPFDVATADDITVEFDAEGLHDVQVAFAQEPGRLRNTATEIYEMCIGGWNNTKTAIRLKSLGASVASFTKENNPEAMLNAYRKQTYSISLKKGVITLNSAGKQALTWTDPYPLKNIKWVGLSTWDAPISYSNISVRSGNQPAKGKNADATESALLAKAGKALGKPVTMKSANGKKPAPVLIDDAAEGALADDGSAVVDDAAALGDDISDEELDALIAQAEAEAAAAAPKPATKPVAKQVQPAQKVIAVVQTQKNAASKQPKAAAARENARVAQLRSQVNDDSATKPATATGDRKVPQGKKAAQKKAAQKKAAQKKAAAKQAIPARPIVPAVAPVVIVRPIAPPPPPVAIDDSGLDDASFDEASLGDSSSVEDISAMGDSAELADDESIAAEDMGEEAA